MSIASKTAERPLRHVAIVTDLNAQWRRLNCGEESAPQVEAALSQWRRTGPFQSVDTLEGALDAIEANANGCLRTLVTASQAGDSIAARTIIQTLLPKVICIAKSQSSYLHFGPMGPSPLDELVTMGVGILWELIGSYPITRRQGSVAGNLSLDLLKRVRKETLASRSEDPHEVDDVLEMCGPMGQEAFVRASEGWGPLQDTLTQASGASVSDELASVLQMAVDEGVIDADEALLLVSYYFEGGATAATRTGLSASAVRVRSHRLRGRLRQQASNLASTS